MCVERKTNAFFERLRTIWEFQEVSQSCNMLQLCVERCGSVSPVYRYVLTISINIKILHKFFKLH